MTSSDARLRMETISKRFGATVALEDVSLEVAPGEVCALVGENGAGKSTLMKILSGAYVPDRGAMWLDDEPYQPRGPLEGRRAGVAMIYQELSLALHLSVEENILLGVEPTRGFLLDGRESRRRVAAAMAEVGLEGQDPRTPVRRLSIAERQRVEIARAVALGFRVLVLDEPTSSLGQDDIRRLFALIRRLRSQGHAIVYISHFLEEVEEVADRYLVLRDGRPVAGGAMADTDPERLAEKMVGRNVEDLYPRSEREPGEVVLEVDGLEGVRGPAAASLTLHRGEILGVAGLVGAGRTELLRAIFCLDPVRRGAVKLARVDGRSSTPARWAQGVGMVSEDRREEGLAVGLSVADNLTLSRLPLWLSPARLEAAAQRWIDDLSIRTQGPRQTVSDLSGGNQQKIAIARLLHHDVDVLLLDEPTRGIDVGSKAEIYRWLDELARHGKAILMVSSYLPELLGVCDRIAVMARGRLHPARPVGELDEHRIMLEATGADGPATEGAA